MKKKKVKLFCRVPKIYDLKIILLTVLVFSQSCGYDEFVQNESKDDFLITLQGVNSNMSNVAVFNWNKETNIKAGELNDLTDIQLEIKEPKDQTYVIEDFTHVIDLINQDVATLLAPESNCIQDSSVGDVCLEVHIDESDVYKSLEPSFQSARNYLYSYGFTDYEINTEFGNDSQSAALILAALILDAEFNYEENASNGYARGSFGSCLMDVVGITALVDVAFALGKLYGGEVSAGMAVDAAAASAFRKSAIKAAKKVITKLAGPIGAAIMIGELLYCMSK